MFSKESSAATPAFERRACYRLRLLCFLDELCSCLAALSWKRRKAVAIVVGALTGA